MSSKTSFIQNDFLSGILQKSHAEHQSTSAVHQVEFFQKDFLIKVNVIIKKISQNLQFRLISAR